MVREYGDSICLKLCHVQSAFGCVKYTAAGAVMKNKHVLILIGDIVYLKLCLFQSIIAPTVFIVLWSHTCLTQQTQHPRRLLSS